MSRSTQPLRIGDSLKQPNDGDTGWYCRLVTPWTLSTENSQIKAPVRSVLLQMSTNSSDGRGHTSRGSYTSRVTRHVHSLVQHKQNEVNKTHILGCTQFCTKQLLVELNEIMSHGISDSALTYRGVQIPQTRWFSSRALLSNMSNNQTTSRS